MLVRLIGRSGDALRFCGIHTEHAEQIIHVAKLGGAGDGSQGIRSIITTSVLTNGASMRRQLPHHVLRHAG